MMSATPYHRYQQVQVEGADEGALVLMLYDGALRFLEKGHKAMVEKDYHKAYMEIIRVERILNELMSCLNLEAGEIAHNLMRLYEFMEWRLILANKDKDPNGVLEVSKLLGSLRDAWVEAARIEREKKAKGSKSEKSTPQPVSRLEEEEGRVSSLNLSS
jgi:flagellar protein FliS